MRRTTAIALGMLLVLALALVALSHLKPAAASERTVSRPTQQLRTHSHPRAGVRAADSQALNSPFTNTYTRVANGEPARHPAPEQLDAYLRVNRRSAESLLAAWRASDDKVFLREAMEKYPNDPRVAFQAFFFAEPYDRDKPASEERRKWLVSFKQSDPDNALPDYLAAGDAFRSGQKDLALQELQAASGKSTFQDYLLDTLQNTEEAYRAAGYSEAEAKMIASEELLLPHLYEAKQVARNLADLVTQYRQAGDDASAQAVLRMGIDLGERFNGPGEFPLINSLVGIASERLLLNAMDPNSPFLDTGRTVQDQLDAFQQRRASITALVTQSDAVFAQMSDADLVAYLDRLRMFGAEAAMRWAVGKYNGQ